MYPSKKLLTLVCIMLCAAPLFSQDKLKFKFGTVKKEDFDITSPLIDSSANAVVIADFGKSEFTANASDQTFSLIFQHKKRIKIINKNGFDAGTVIIPLYVNSSNNGEKLQELKAYTYNMENGKVVETKLDKDQVFTEKYDKNWIHKKFTFPALKEGSIIEFSYEVKSDFFFNLQSWEFQGQYPVLWSQYEAAIPEFFKYVITTQGYHAYAVNKTDQSTARFTFTEHVERESVGNVVRGSGIQNFTVDGTLDYHTWIMKDVPGLKEEPFTTTVRNSISKIEFQLQQVAYRGSIPRNYTNTWEKLSSELLEDENFGYQINRPNLWLDNDVDDLVKGIAGPLDKAKKIYQFVRNNFTCTSYSRFMASGNLKEVFKNKSGSVADINLLLMAMLKSQKIDVEPVLISTREHGIINPYYPMIEKFNYVIARVNIADELVYLDASRKGLPFGRLPLQVYNGHARVISKSAPAVYFEADSLHETSMTTVFISNEEKGGVSGFINNVYGMYGSLDMRSRIARQTEEAYKKTLQESYSEDIDVSSVSIDSLNLLDQPVALKLDIKLKAFGDADIVYFNPLMGEAIKTNPFASAQRFYPVEMPYAKKTVYVLNMEIPEGYKVDELPKSARVSLNDDDGMFEYLISNDGKYVQMKCLLDIKTASFTNEDYQTLRDFYSFVVKKEAEQVVFKKIK